MEEMGTAGDDDSIVVRVHDLLSSHVRYRVRMTVLAITVFAVGYGFIDKGMTIDVDHWWRMFIHNNEAFEDG